MTATERFKRLLADALERVCVLEEQLEQAQARIAEPRAAARPDEDDPHHLTPRRNPMQTPTGGPRPAQP